MTFGHGDVSPWDGGETRANVDLPPGAANDACESRNCEERSSGAYFERWTSDFKSGNFCRQTSRVDPEPFGAFWEVEKTGLGSRVQGNADSRDIGV